MNSGEEYRRHNDSSLMTRYLQSLCLEAKEISPHSELVRRAFFLRHSLRSFGIQHLAGSDLLVGTDWHRQMIEQRLIAPYPELGTTHCVYHAEEAVGSTGEQEVTFIGLAKHPASVRLLRLDNQATGYCPHIFRGVCWGDFGDHR